MVKTLFLGFLLLVGINDVTYASAQEDYELDPFSALTYLPKWNIFKDLTLGDLLSVRETSRRNCQDVDAYPYQGDKHVIGVVAQFPAFEWDVGGRVKSTDYFRDISTYFSRALLEGAIDLQDIYKFISLVSFSACSRENPQGYTRLQESVIKVYAPENFPSFRAPVDEAQSQQLTLNGLNMGFVSPTAVLFTECLNLKILEKYITRLPLSIWQMGALQSLDLTGCTLASLSGDICLLQNLRVLKVSENPIQELGDGVGRLINLTELEARDCRLAYLPDLSNLQGLTSLDVYDNNLYGVPVSLSRIVSLEKLDISKNRLSAVPDPIAALTSLQKLDVSDNTITQLPAELFTLPSLSFVGLSRNYLSPEVLQYIPRPFRTHILPQGDPEELEKEVESAEKKRKTF